MWWHLNALHYLHGTLAFLELISYIDHVFFILLVGHLWKSGNNLANQLLQTLQAIYVDENDLGENNNGKQKGTRIRVL